MPFTLLSHQAPALPLKLWRPGLFCGTALALGSMAPDLEYFMQASPEPVHGHTLYGQFLFCLPLTIALVWLLRRVMPTLAAHLPDCGPFHLRDYALISHAKMDGPDLARVVTSALIGSFSHIIADSFTHKHGWVVERVPALQILVGHLGKNPIYMFRALQLGGSVVLALATLAMLHSIGRHRRLREWYSAAPILPAAQPALFWSVGLITGALGTTTRLAHDHFLRYLDEPIAWGWAVLYFTVSTFLGCCVATMIIGLRRGAAGPSVSPRADEATE